MDKQEQKKFFRALTRLRAFAVFGVVAFHLSKDSGSWVPFFRPIVYHGYLGVDLFFVLSGFIIHHIYSTKFSEKISKSDYAGFIRNRFARIYPVHFLTLVIMLFYSNAAMLILHHAPKDANAFSSSSIIASLLLVHGWFNIPTPNVPAWSVSAEWFAYLLYPCAAFCLSRSNNPARAIIAVCSLVMIALIANDNPLLRICPEFALGMICYDLHTNINFSRRIIRFSGLFVASLLVASCYLVSGEHMELYAALFAVLITVLANENDILGRFLATPIPVYFGEISYSIYMTHGPAWALVKNIVRLRHIPVSSWFVMGFALIFIAVIAAAMFHYVELPARKLLRSTRRTIIETQTT